MKMVMRGFAVFLLIGVVASSNVTREGSEKLLRKMLSHYQYFVRTQHFESIQLTPINLRVRNGIHGGYVTVEINATSVTSGIDKLKLDSCETPREESDGTVIKCTLVWADLSTLFNATLELASGRGIEALSFANYTNDIQQIILFKVSKNGTLPSDLRNRYVASQNVNFSLKTLKAEATDDEFIIIESILTGTVEAHVNKGLIRQIYIDGMRYALRQQRVYS